MTDRIPARMSFVTLAVRDMPAMARFYRQFGWPESKFSDESFIAFQTSGAVLGLFPAKNYEEEFGAPPAPGAFKGFVLAINLEDRARVDAAYETMKVFDDMRILGEPNAASVAQQRPLGHHPIHHVSQLAIAEGDGLLSAMAGGLGRLGGAQLGYQRVDPKVGAQGRPLQVPP